ncbi:unnamed protein product [Adineta steineri]|uniref:Uncharacterized protein n=1 Tax=Adineta steineri TaxID=433720 RepID=A0A820BN55_9BILA|nr:unnamed protein product [Adineta steineri]CAF4201317.1 unnamed protein product [Adineta steineri]
MSIQKDIFSDRSYLKQINKNFDHLIKLIQTTYKPLSLSYDEKLFEINIVSFEFLQEFNGSNQNQQIQLLANINNLHQLWHFLSLNPTSYDCLTFIDELYQLTLTFSSVKQHLALHSEDFLLTLGISYDDNIRFGCFKILALLIDDAQPDSKQTIARFNRICYECLYDFNIYYEEIKYFTIESRIIDLTKDDVNHLINGEDIRIDLEKEINQTIEELGGYVFFKMHRSPKDAYENLSKEINNEWIRIWNLTEDEDPDLNFMKIQNVNQLKLLFKNSDRLRQDLNEISSNEKLILRKWISNISNEYRCFICNGKLNAISTYGSQQNSIENEKQMKDFTNSKNFQDIILTIPYSHGVVDCAIDWSNYNVIIIEINPFSKRSSAAKFSWIIDRDILYYYFNNYGFVNIKF